MRFGFETRGIESILVTVREQLRNCTELKERAAFLAYKNVQLVETLQDDNGRAIFIFTSVTVLSQLCGQLLRHERNRDIRYDQHYSEFLEDSTASDRQHCAFMRWCHIQRGGSLVLVCWVAADLPQVNQEERELAAVGLAGKRLPPYSTGDL